MGIGCIKCDGDPNKWESWHINYDHPESHGDVRGYLTEIEVDIILESIESEDGKDLNIIITKCKMISNKFKEGLL